MLFCIAGLSIVTQISVFVRARALSNMCVQEMATAMNEYCERECMLYV